MDEIQKRLQGISLPEYQLPDYPPAPPTVRVQAARVPIMAGAAPPLYPGNQINNLEKYDIWGDKTKHISLHLILHYIYLPMHNI